MYQESTALDNLALRKMMHDLKGPLTALKILRERHKRGHHDDNLMKHLLQSLEGLLSHCVGDGAPGSRTLDEQKIAQLCEGLIAQKQLVFSSPFHLDFQTQPFRLKLAAIDLQKILCNLLQNAAEACRSTGGEVGLKVSLVNGRVEFTVRDEGLGMDAFALAALKRGTPLKSNGWGVGFMIVHELIKNSGGRLEFCSETGRGSIARVSWPVEA